MVNYLDVITEYKSPTFLATFSRKEFLQNMDRGHILVVFSQKHLAHFGRFFSKASGHPDCLPALLRPI
jgi:hypothetical protein